MKTNVIAALAVAGLIGVTACNKNSEPLTAPEPNVQTDVQEQLIMTPRGMMPASHVHHVSPGQELKITDGKAAIIDLKTNKELKVLGSVQSNKASDNAIKKVTSAGASGTSSLIMGGGYLASYTIPAGEKIQSFSSDFIVPSNIQNTSGTAKFDFLWNAIFTWDGNLFQQPVIYSDWNGRNTGWFLVNWVFWRDASGESHSIYGDAIPVIPGTPVTGKMSLISSSGGTYTYKCEFVGYDDATIQYTYNQPATTVQQCWETYVNPDYTWFPHDTWQRVTNMKLYYVGKSQNQPINWSVVAGNNAVATPNGVNTIFTNNNTSNSIVNFYMGYNGPIQAGRNYKITTAINNTSVLDVTGGSTANGTPVELWGNNTPTSPNQVWRVSSTNNGYTYVLKPLSDTTKALTVNGGGTANGTAINISTYTGSSSQIWRIYYLKNGKYLLVPQNAPYSALDVPWASATSGTKLEIYQSHGGVAQQFNFVVQ